MTTLATAKYFDVEIYSHHFVVRNASPTGQQYVRNFSHNYVQFGLVRVGRVLKRGPIKVFAARTKTKNEFRFHIGQYPAWKKYLSHLGVPTNGYSEVQIGHLEPAPLGTLLKEGWKPKDYQEPIIDYLLSDAPSTRKLVQIQTGQGKASPNDSPVRIPGGWTQLGQLDVGDSVISRDGSTTKVTGVYPQGFKDIFEVTYDDGRRAQFCAEHQWIIYSPDSVTGETEPRLADTREVISLLQAKKASVMIDLIESEPGFRLSTPVEPYKFGKKGDITNEGLGAYLNGSHGQRLALMHGLLENDSELTDDGSLTITVTELGIAQQIQYLARSLGSVAYLSIVDAALISELADNKDYKHLGYTVEIFHRSIASLFRGKRKDLKKYDRPDLRLGVQSVIPLGVKEAVCISVEHPDSLYVTSDFTVTHNTFCAAAAISKIGHRMVAFLKPKYIEKWISDLNELLGISKDEIEVIQGGASLMKVISMAREGTLTAKAIIVSNRTYQTFITAYEEKGDAVMDDGYDCIPSEFIQVTGCGVRLVDEAHEDFHLNFKIDLYTHVKKSISLSATMVSEDELITKMHSVAFDPTIRYSGLAYKRYVTSNALLYRIKDGHKLKSTEFGSNNYSHIAFEKNFFKDEKLRKAYLDLIVDRVGLHFIFRRELGQKCLVYAASIQMCTYIVEHLKKKYYDFDVRRYVEDDPYENLMEADICVSTVGSAGTGHDIKGLITVIMTVSIASKASNIQGFGRLRDLVGFEMWFEYFTCLDILKQVDYHQRKELLLAGMAKQSHKETLDYILGVCA